MKVREGQLVFEFPDDVRVERMDGADSPVPETMKKVDFAIEEPERILLVEVKDPSDYGTAETNRTDFVRRLKSGPLVNETLVPKCRDTYTFLHLMGRDAKPLLYVVLISTYDHKESAPHFHALKQKLAARLKKEGKLAWKRPYVTGCVVVNTEGWKQHFHYEVTRDQGPR
jgi:hypothetical protein